MAANCCASGAISSPCGCSGCSRQCARSSRYPHLPGQREMPRENGATSCGGAWEGHLLSRAGFVAGKAWVPDFASIDIQATGMDAQQWRLIAAVQSPSLPLRAWGARCCGSQCHRLVAVGALRPFTARGDQDLLPAGRTRAGGADCPEGRQAVLAARTGSEGVPATRLREAGRRSLAARTDPLHPGGAAQRPGLRWQPLAASAGAGWNTAPATSGPRGSSATSCWPTDEG